MSDPVLVVRDLKKSFGDAQIIRGVDLSIERGERHALIGPNGAGKSTLFHLISGNTPPSSGAITFDGQAITGWTPQRINRAGLARSFQITNVFPRLTVFENIRMAVMQRQRVQYTLWRPIEWMTAIRDATEELLARVRLERQATALAGEMTYSAQRSLELAMTLASDPKLILLDEPMAGMSSEETDYTLALIRELTEGRALLLVEHDMDVVFALSDRVSVLVYGEVVATGTPAEIRADRAVREAYLGDQAGDQAGEPVDHEATA